MRNRLFSITVAVPLSLALISGISPSLANAQTSGPSLVVTWRATDSSVPTSYAGKALPTVGSPVTASVMVVSNGTVVNIANQTIYWYLDGNLVAGGTGKQTISFTLPAYIEIASLRADLPNYPSGALINTAHIQMVAPAAVIVAPYPNDLYAGSSLALQAVPYFFSAKALTSLYYQWTVNGQAVTTQENPQDLAVNLSGSGSVPVLVSLALQESSNSLMNARSSITLNPAQ